MVITNQKYVIDSQKPKRKELTHATKENHPTTKGKKEEIQSKMQEYFNYRKEKQPIEYPSAGSTFKRGTDFITAKLIDECGLKGYQIGGAQISEKHAGFIINKKEATAKDVEKLIEYTKEKVYEKFGKKIETEIEIIK